VNVVIAVLMKQLEDANIKDQEESILERELAQQQQQNEQQARQAARHAAQAAARPKSKLYAVETLLAGGKESSYSLNYTKAGATITYRL